MSAKPKPKPDEEPKPESIKEWPRTTPVFGDPEWLRRRGKSTIRKTPRLRKGRKRYWPVWQRIEGSWRRMRCPICKAVSFSILKQRDPFVDVRCAAGHFSVCLVGFTCERPEDED